MPAARAGRRRKNGGAYWDPSGAGQLGVGSGAPPDTSGKGSDEQRRTDNQRKAANQVAASRKRSSGSGAASAATSASNTTGPTKRNSDDKFHTNTRNPGPGGFVRPEHPAGPQRPVKERSSGTGTVKNTNPPKTGGTSAKASKSTGPKYKTPGVIDHPERFMKTHPNAKLARLPGGGAILTSNPKSGGRPTGRKK